MENQKTEKLGANFPLIPYTTTTIREINIVKIEMPDKMVEMFINAETREKGREKRIKDYKEGMELTICMEQRSLTIKQDQYGTWWLNNHND